MGNQRNETTGKKRYVVAPGAAFVGKKRSYVAGDEIDASAFGKPEYFNKMLRTKPPRIIEAPQKDEKEEKTADDSAAAEKRKALEEKAVSSGLLKLDELEKYSDEQLEKTLKDHGVS